MQLTKEMFKEMLIEQDKLNSIIDPNWKENRTLKDFTRAIWIECAELVESLPWKWWKKTEPNWDNVKIEIVDIWHFILSSVLLEFDDIDEAAQFLEGDINNEDEFSTYPDPEHVIELTEKFMEAYIEDFIDVSLYLFGKLIISVMPRKDLYLLYMGKNILNHIRQEKGYKTGEYEKYLNGKEDNEFLIEIVKDVTTKEELEKKLREIFA